VHLPFSRSVVVASLTSLSYLLEKCTYMKVVYTDPYHLYGVLKRLERSNYKASTILAQENHHTMTPQCPPGRPDSKCRFVELARQGSLRRAQ